VQELIGKVSQIEVNFEICIWWFIIKSLKFKLDEKSKIGSINGGFQ